MSYVDADAVLRKLVAVATAALPDRQVLDGRDYSAEVEHSALLIGYTGEESSPAVEVSRDQSAGSLDDGLYDVVVRATAAEWDGDNEFAAKRARAQATLEGLNTAIEANRSLDGTVYDAWLTPTAQWFQIANAQGNGIEVDIAITVQVYA